jgi:inner membrane protein
LDNLTHTLAGVMLARAGLGRLTPKGTSLILVASNIPDIDVIAGLWGADVYLEHHRGFTHSLLGLPVMVLLTVGLFVVLFRRSIRTGPAVLLATVGLLVHIAFDWTNVYGIRLLTPLNETWYRLDITAVIDLWIWLVLIPAFLWPLLARLVSSEIGAKPSSGQGMAFAALLFLLAYNGARYAAHTRAEEILDARLHEGRPPVRVAALPSFTNPLAWTGLIEIEDAYLVNQVDLWRTYDPAAARTFYKPPAQEWIERARETPAFRRFLGFSQFPLWRVTTMPEPEGARRVECLDLRFGVPGEGRFTAVAIFNPDGRLDRARFEFGAPRPGAGFR